MTKKQILKLIEPWADDVEIAVSIELEAEHLDELEPGSLLDVTDAGFTRGTYVLYVRPR